MHTRSNGNRGLISERQNGRFGGVFFVCFLTSLLCVMKGFFNNVSFFKAPPDSPLFSISYFKKRANQISVMLHDSWSSLSFVISCQINLASWSARMFLNAVFDFGTELCPIGHKTKYSKIIK